MWVLNCSGGWVGSAVKDFFLKKVDFFFTPSLSNLAKSRLQWLNQSSESLPKIISLSSVYFPFSFFLFDYLDYMLPAEILSEETTTSVHVVCVCLDNSKHICSRCLQIFFAKYFGALGLTELWAEGRPIWASLSVWEQDQEIGRPTRGPRPIWAQSRKCNW